MAERSVPTDERPGAFEQTNTFNAIFDGDGEISGHPFIVGIYADDLTAAERHARETTPIGYRLMSVSEVAATDVGPTWAARYSGWDEPADDLDEGAGCGTSTVYRAQQENPVSTAWRRQLN